MQQQQNCDDGEIEEDTGTTQIPGKEAKREFKQFDGRDKMQPLLKHHSTIIHVSSGRIDNIANNLHNYIAGVKSRDSQHQTFTSRLARSYNTIIQ